MIEIQGEIHERSEIDDAYFVWIPSLNTSVKVLYEGDDLHQGRAVTLLDDGDGNYTFKPPEEDTSLSEFDYRMLLRRAKIIELDAIEQSIGMSPTTAEIVAGYLQGLEDGSTERR